MLDFKTYRENTPAQPVAAPDSTIDAEVDSIVDKWVSELIASLTTGVGPGHPTDGTSLSPPYGQAQKRGLWDRFKGTLSNLWWGRDHKNNPYRWVNKFGDDLGVESFLNSISLQDYKLLKETCDELEQQLNEVNGVENLRLVKIIRASAEHLKNYLKQALANTAAVATAKPDFGKMGAHSAGIDANKGTESPATQPQDATAQQPQDTTQDATTQQPQDTTAQDAKDTAQQPQDQQQPAHNEYNTPPTVGKKWADLSAEEIESWNNYGGKKIGGMRPITSRCLKYLKGNTPTENATPITQIPWVLRLGDPRIEILQSLSKESTARFADTHLGQVPPEILKRTPKFCKSDSKLYKILLNSGGIETPINKIESEDDLRSKIEEAKIAIKRTPVDTAMATPEAPTTPTPEDDDSFVATAAPVEPKEKEDRAKRIKPDFAPNSSAIQPKPRKKNRRGKTRLTNPPVQTPSEDMEDERYTGEFQEKLKAAEDKLDDAIIKHPDHAEFWNQLQQKLEKFSEEPSTMAELDKYIAALDNDIEEIEGLAGLGDFSNEWNLSNYVEFYKNKLSSRV